MESKKDLIPLPAEFPFRIFHAVSRTSEVPLLHWHDCLELNLILSGKGINIIGKTKYELQPGEVYVINNNEHHYAFSDSSLDMLVIVFDPIFIWMNNSFDYDYLRPFFERKVNFNNCIYRDTPLALEIGALMIEIEKEFTMQDSGSRLIIKALLMKLLALLYRHLKLEGQIGDEVLKRQKEFDRIKTAVTYIDHHFTGDINLDHLAGLVYMNPSYFSSFFKKVMKMNLSNYISTLRINHAAALLKHTSKNITEICSESGFCSLSHFNRAFKGLTGLSPSEYRYEKASIQK